MVTIPLTSLLAPLGRVGGTHTTTIWGVRYNGRTYPVVDPQTGATNRERAERDLADLLANRGIVGQVVSRTVTIGEWEDA